MVDIGTSIVTTIDVLAESSYAIGEDILMYKSDIIPLSVKLGNASFVRKCEYDVQKLEHEKERIERIIHDCIALMQLHEFKDKDIDWVDRSYVDIILESLLERLSRIIYWANSEQEISSDGIVRQRSNEDITSRVEIEDTMSNLEENEDEYSLMYTEIDEFIEHVDTTSEQIKDVIETMELEKDRVKVNNSLKIIDRILTSTHFQYSSYVLPSVSQGSGDHANALSLVVKLYKHKEQEGGF